MHRRAGIVKSPTYPGSQSYVGVPVATRRDSTRFDSHRDRNAPRRELVSRFHRVTVDGYRSTSFAEKIHGFEPRRGPEGIGLSVFGRGLGAHPWTKGDAFEQRVDSPCDKYRKEKNDIDYVGNSFTSVADTIVDKKITRTASIYETVTRYAWSTSGSRSRNGRRCTKAR